MDELKTLLRSVPEDKPWQRTMFLVAYWHGARVSELAELKGKDIKDGYVDLRRKKNSEHTVQPYVFHVDPELDEGTQLTELVRRRGPEESLFGLSKRGIQDLMVRISKRTGLNRKKAHPHALKHTCAMHGIQRGVGIEVMRSVLGHKSLSSTGFYTKIAQDDAMSAFAKAMGGSS